ncbi:Sec-independent protein translocase subunit TatA [Rouxiella chamberiensis]|uniref:Sec-independent protein translocase protein TatA n=1 Tax=Rouxiella chamberiensis TaxID=1513468 RepID=A0ABY7HN00_9GAMM|nr:Sec-independent protein translocase subunit TatA [Rouxiella chamberiensis]WAT00417.1 Sec-independent protein translocase subunit TatA [Rouxiella chamberiensis]
MGAFSLTHWLVIAVIVVLLFGTKKLRGLGSDLGASIKGFKKAMNDDDKTKTHTPTETTGSDAEFTAKSLEGTKPEIKAEETKSQNKEQV